MMITVADLIAALQAFSPDALVGTSDHLTGDAVHLVHPEVNGEGIVIVGSGERYTGRIWTHHCDSDCSLYCDL